MLLPAIAATMLAAATPQVDVGNFDPRTFPDAQMQNRVLPQAQMVNLVEQTLREGDCEIPGQSFRSFDIRVPYLVQLQPDGTASRIVIRDLGCEQIHVLAGRVVMELDRLRDFRPTGRPDPAWYRSELRFTLE
jgi:hypothetical protein